MKSLFEPSVTDEMIDRLNHLTPETQALWGKMKVAQMVAHLEEPLKIAVGEGTMKKGLMGFLFGRIAKKQLVNEKPFKRNLPTASGFVIKTEKDLSEEKEKLVRLIRKFQNTSAEELNARVHPFFGKLTAEEWNVLQWKHLDHHLSQFGV